MHCLIFTLGIIDDTLEMASGQQCTWHDHKCSWITTRRLPTNNFNNTSAALQKQYVYNALDIFYYFDSTQNYTTTTISHLVYIHDLPKLFMHNAMHYVHHNRSRQSSTTLNDGLSLERTYVVAVATGYYLIAERFKRVPHYYGVI